MHIQASLTRAKRQNVSCAAFFALTLLPLYYCSYRWHINHPYGSHGTRPASTDFISDWQNTQLIEPFNPYAIAAYCNRSTWDENLVLQLNNANGGIGNVRGNVLDFLLLAIEVGAGIILPGMAKRGESDLSNVWGGRSEFREFFDEDWFLAQISLACAQMTVYKPKAGQAMKSAINAGKGNFVPRSRRMDLDATNSRVEAESYFRTWLTGQEGYEAEEMTVVNVERTLWDVDTRQLPAGVRRNLGGLLKLNPTVRGLAAVIVRNLAHEHHLHLDPRDPVPSHSYFGAHLRTEADAQNAGWLQGDNANFSAQTDAYIAHAHRHKLRVIYAASGNATDLHLFRERAMMHNPPLNVTSKHTLLGPGSAEAVDLAALSWDQQALVDYAVLQRCSVFAGFVKSSFSYNLAITRNQWLDDTGLVTDPWTVLSSETEVAFDDSISRIVGRDAFHEVRIPRGMWP